MNKIIYLETDEEITSVVDKLRKIKTRDIVLVAPKRCTLVQSIVNLKLLKRQAKLLGKKIILVTQDITGQNLATKAGIPTKKEIEGKEISLKEAKISAKPAGKVEKPKLKKEKEEIILPEIRKIRRVSISDIVAKMEKPEEKISKSVSEAVSKAKEVSPKVVLLPSFNVKAFTLFIVGIVIVCGIVGLVILPSCTVAITPKTEPLSKDIEVIIAKDKVSDLENDIIGGEVKSAEIESTFRRFKSSGQKEIEQRAEGRVVVYNSYSSDPQVLEANSRLKSSVNGLIYLTLNKIEIPGAKVGEGKTLAGQAEVDIRAEKAGKEYNLNSSRFTLLDFPPAKQATIWAETKNSISGGESKKIKIVTNSDIQEAQNSLVAELIDRAKKELQAKISRKEKFVEEALNKKVQVLDVDAQPGDEVDSFKMKIKLSIETLVFKEKDIETLVKEKLKRLVPEEKYVLDKPNEGISYKVAGFDPTTGNLRMIVHIQKTIAWKIDKKKIRTSIMGKNSEEVKEYLIKNPHISEVEVKFWPIWVKRVPYLEKKINIKTSFEEP